MSATAPAPYDTRPLFTVYARVSGAIVGFTARGGYGDAVSFMLTHQVGRATPEAITPAEAEAAATVRDGYAAYTGPAPAPLTPAPADTIAAPVSVDWVDSSGEYVLTLDPAGTYTAEFAGDTYRGTWAPATAAECAALAGATDDATPYTHTVTREEWGIVGALADYLPGAGVFSFAVLTPAHGVLILTDTDDAR